MCITSIGRKVSTNALFVGWISSYRALNMILDQAGRPSTMLSTNKTFASVQMQVGVRNYIPPKYLKYDTQMWKLVRRVDEGILPHPGLYEIHIHYYVLLIGI